MLDVQVSGWVGFDPHCIIFCCASKLCGAFVDDVLFSNKRCSALVTVVMYPHTLGLTCNHLH